MPFNMEVMVLTIEVTLLIAGASALCGWLGYSRGKAREDKSQGHTQGELEADIRYIRAGIDDIRKTVENHDIKIWDLVKDMVEVKASSKQAHHRLDSLEKRGE